MKQLLIILTACLALTACRTARHAERGSSLPATERTPGTPPSGARAEAAAYAARVAKKRVAAPCVTASVKLALTGLRKELNVNAQLRMRRDDVVRLSLRFLGMEVGLLECTPQDLLLVNRAHKQYMRLSYHEVPYLQQAGIDFYAIQALFWDELFAPGERQAERAAKRFALEQAMGQCVLALTDAPLLTYRFTTDSRRLVVQRLDVKPRQEGADGSLTWEYADFTQFAGRPFPTRMRLTAQVGQQPVSLQMELSGLKTDSDWNPRTTVSAKYRRVSWDDRKHFINP